jgi:hypothetical protein
MTNVDFTLGADPELFLYDTLKKEYVPSNTYFTGSKDNPTVFGEGYAVLCDNFMVEFNIPPQKTMQEFTQVLLNAIGFIQSRVPEFVEIHFTDTVKFKEEHLNNESAYEFGCMPQLNIYNAVCLDMSEIPPNIRFAGGHIHFGTTQKLNYTRIVKCFDLFIGIPLKLRSEDSEISRDLVYGNLGTYRETSYGFEYRTPSNIWLQDSETMSWVFNQANKAFKIYQDSDLVLPNDLEMFTAEQSKEGMREILQTLLIEA